MDENTKVVIITALGTVATIATAYIAARWHVTYKSNKDDATLQQNTLQGKMDASKDGQGDKPIV